MTPLLVPYWDESGRQVMGRLGLDPDEWRVTSPYLRAQIEAQAFAFCESTLATTSHQVDDAYTRLRAELAAGLVDHGEALPELRRRVQAVFEQIADWKATQIAATEASRAVHAAQLEADRQSGVVAGLEILPSSDACPLCRKIHDEARRVRLGQAFAIIGTSPTYRDVRHAPFHVGCQCTVIEVLIPELGGPEHPAWAETLIQPQKRLAA